MNALALPDEFFWAVLPTPLHSNVDWDPAANSKARPLITDSNPISPKQCRECLPKTTNRGITSNRYGAAIAVGCCDLTGGNATRLVTKKNKCLHSVDWLTATQQCQAHGKRLCTDDEIEASELAYKGCDTDALLHWTNTPCYEVTPPSNKIYKV